MGRRRESSYIRALKGKKSRVAPEQEVTYPVVKGAEIRPPDYLDEFGLAHWKRMVSILDSIGMFQAPTRDKLGHYCQAVADYEAMQEQRRKLGKKKDTVTDSNGYQLSHWARMIKVYGEIMSEFEGEYGLTPASAAKLTRPKDSKKEASKLVDFVEAKADIVG